MQEGVGSVPNLLFRASQTEEYRSTEESVGDLVVVRSS